MIGRLNPPATPIEAKECRRSWRRTPEVQPQRGRGTRAYRSQQAALPSRLPGMTYGLPSIRGSPARTSNAGALR